MIQFLVLHDVKKSPVFFCRIQPKVLATVLLGALPLLLVVSAPGCSALSRVGALGSLCSFAAHRSSCFGTCVLFFR